VANKTLFTKRVKRNLLEAPLCCENLISFSETALCRGSLVLQRSKDLMPSTNGPTFSVLVMLRIAVSVFPLLKEQRNSVAKECATRQKRGPAITSRSIINQVERLCTDNTNAQFCEHYSYRPIFLLCAPFNILERPIYARIESIIDPLLPREQVGFRHGRSTVDQVTLLT